MKSIAFIVPYFGALPNYFAIWLQSCAQNPSIDFFVFTDQIVTDSVPNNVRIVPMVFAEAKELLQAQFEFPIGLSKPYKLCDYKPVYGAAFSRWVSNYDYWGHCDIDLIWGNIRTFFTDELLEKYDRILNQGHCSVYRNCEKVNRYYRTLDSMGCMDWRTVYSSERHFSFDEYAEHNGGGLSLIMEKNNVPIYAEWPFANIEFRNQYFQLTLTNDKYFSCEEDLMGCFFERNRDGLYFWYRKDGNCLKEEFMYVHFSKRVIKGADRCAGSEYYILVPPGLLMMKMEPIALDTAERIMKDNIARVKRISYNNERKTVQFAKRVVRRVKRMMQQ